MATALVTIGPVPAASARAWIASARETIATVGRRPDLGVPPDVVAAFAGYIDDWAALADGGETFLWTGSLDPGMVRHLAAHWARLVTLARADPEGSGLRRAAPESEEFYNALATALLEAVAVDDAEGFTDRFEEVVPAFDADVPSAQTPAARRVLLVDDNEDIRLLMRLTLERDPRFDVAAEAQNGEEAVAYCRTHCPDAVLLDLLMPVMDGYAALPQIKQLCPQATVVVFSAIESPDTVERVIRAGASAFLQKTADTTVVLDALAG